MANALLRNGFHRGKVFRYSGSRVAMCGQRSDRARSRAPRQPSPKCPVQCLVKSLWLWGGPSLSNQAGSSTLSLFVISTTSEAKASPAAHGDDKPHSSISDTRLSGSCVLALPQATVPGTPSTELLHEHRPRYCTNIDRGIARIAPDVQGLRALPKAGILCYILLFPGGALCLQSSSILLNRIEILVTAYKLLLSGT